MWVRGTAPADGEREVGLLERWKRWLDMGVRPGLGMVREG